MPMRPNSFIFLAVLFILFATACDPSGPVITDKKAYQKSIEDWNHSRLERLKGKSGWLNLAGLYWLQDGENRFGSDADNDIVFPEKADPFCGTLRLHEGKVTLQVKQGVEIRNGDIPVKEMELRDDQSENPTLLEQGDLAWYIIKRGEDYGIRLRDYRHPRIDKLDHIPAYPVSIHYVVEASLVPFDRPRNMNVATPVEGFTETYQCPGELHFRLQRKNLVLYPFSSGESYFIVFADETTGIDTYGAGRFMYAETDSTGRIILDFNKAYNPPCAFSPFATCPMPPKENFLPVAVEAGEKSVHLF